MKNKVTSSESKSKSRSSTGLLTKGIQKLQASWARAMSALFNRLPAPWRKIVLAAMGIVMMAYSTILIAGGIGGRSNPFGRPVDIRMPIATRSMTARAPDQMPAVVVRVRQFKKYLDSLARSNDGTAVRDSILRHHPGLLDSIDKIRDIYCW